MDRHEESRSQLTVIGSLCGGSGSCPTVYRTGHGDLVVQGRAIDPGSVGIALPAGEALVEIPGQLLAALTAPGDGRRPPAQVDGRE